LDSLSDRSPWLAPIAWSGIAIAIGAIAAPLDPNLLEEGIVVHTAERMLAGDHLYRDILIHTAPLPYELLALLYRVFGASIEVARITVVVLQGIAVGLLFATLRRGGAGVLAHPGAAAIAAAPILLVPLFSTFFYTTLAFYLGVIALYTALRGLESSPWAFATGVLLACVALCKQSAGVVLVATLVPAMLVSAEAPVRLRRVSWVVAGGALMTLLTLALYLLRGDLGALWFAQVEIPLSLAARDTFRTPLINLWPPGKLDPIVQESWVMYLPSLYHMRYGLFAVIGPAIVVATQLLYLFPFAALGLTALAGVLGRATPLLWLNGAFLAAMTLNLVPRADWGHLVVALPPALVQGLLLVPGLRRAPTRPIAIAVLVALLSATAFVGVWLHRIAGEPTFGPRVPLKPVSRAYRTPALPRVIHYLRRQVQPGEAIFVPRQEPLLYFATETTNPTPFEGVLPGLPELQEETILEALASVRFVVMSDIDQPIYTYYADELPAVQDYLERHFAIPPDFPKDDHSWITVLRRSQDRGETLIDLVDLREQGRPWMLNRYNEEVDANVTPQRLATRHLNRPLPVALDDHGGGIDFELEIPEDAVFQAGVGYRGLVSVDYQYEHPRGTTLAVSIRRAGQLRFDRVAQLKIDDSPRGGRSWRALQADLAPWAGEQVTLRLAVQARGGIRGDRLSWWGSPRIARKVD
jgi:hypothetical protein